MSTFFRKAKWDSVNSTYKQIIHFQNGKSIDGYSKRIGFDEVKNHQLLLQNWILRSFKDGYLNSGSGQVDPVICIEYFFRSTDQRFIHAFTLYQDYFEWNPDHYREYLDQFFVKFYGLKQAGKNPYQILYSNHRSKRPCPLSLDTKRFTNKDSLKQHCIRIMLDDSFAKGKVIDFFIQYSNRHLDGFNQAELEVFNHLNFKSR